MMVYYQKDESDLTIALMEKVFLNEKARSLLQNSSSNETTGSIPQEKALILTSRNICQRCGLMGHKKETCRSPPWRVNQFKDSGYNPELFSSKNNKIERQARKYNKRRDNRRTNGQQESSAMAQETVLTISDMDNTTLPQEPIHLEIKNIKRKRSEIEEIVLAAADEDGKDKVNIYLDSGTTCYIFKIKNYSQTLNIRNAMSKE